MAMMTTRWPSAATGGVTKWVQRRPTTHSVVAGAPLPGAHDAVNQRTASGQPYAAEEALPVERALRHFTVDAAYAEFVERPQGPLTVGRRADIAILGEQPTAVAPTQIAHIPIMATVVGVRVAWQNGL